MCMYAICVHWYLYRVNSKLLSGIMSHLGWSHPPHKHLDAVTPCGHWALVVRYHCELGIV